MFPGQTFLLAAGAHTLLYCPLQRVACLVQGEPRALARNPESLGQVLASVAAAPVDLPRPGQGPLSPQFLGIVSTRRCEMGCRYCGFAAGDDGGELEPATALAALDWYAEQVCARPGRQELAVELFGGEPLAAPDLLHAVTLRCQELARRGGLRPGLRMLTGSVGEASLIQLVADTFTHVTLSVDGPPQLHDRLRPLRSGRASYGQVARTARTLRRGQTGLGLRVCVTSETVEQMPQTAAFLAAEMTPDELSFEPLEASSMARRQGLSAPDARAFVRGFLVAERQLERAGIEAVHATSSLQQLRVSFCPTGSDGVIVGPGGTVSACYLPAAQWRARGLELRYGRFAGDGTLQLEHRRLAGVRALNLLQKPRCRRCFARWHCAGGCHVHHTYPGCSEQRDELCLITRAIVYARLLSQLQLQAEAEAFAEDPFDPVELEVELDL